MAFDTGMRPSVGRRITLHAGNRDLAATTSLLARLDLTVEDLKAYQAHPVHVEFGGWLRPLLTSRVVVDYDQM